MQSVPPGPHDEFPSKFIILERKMKRVRYLDIKDYHTEVETKNKWLNEQLDGLKTIKHIDPLSVPYQYHLFENGDQGD
jgi:hypothetical protein